MCRFRAQPSRVVFGDRIVTVGGPSAWRGWNLSVHFTFKREMTPGIVIVRKCKELNFTSLRIMRSGFKAQKPDLLNVFAFALNPFAPR